MKILWRDEDIPKYSSLLGDQLDVLFSNFGDSSSPSSVSSLLSTTYAILSNAAQTTQRHIQLGTERKPDPQKHPEIKSAQGALIKANKAVSDLKADPDHLPAPLEVALEHRAEARTIYKQTIRKEQQKDNDECDSNLNNMLSNSQSFYHSVKSMKSSSTKEIDFLSVGDKTYHGRKIPDGFYDSLSQLKSPDMSSIHFSPSYQSALSDYENILKIASEGLKIPQISPSKAIEILFGMHANVCDLFSITPNPFIHAGPAGLQHFWKLLNLLISNVNFCTLEALNSVFACILFKGHG